MDELQARIKKVVFRHCNTRPHKLQEERLKFLSDFMSRWTGGRDAMRFPQFVSAIRSLNVRVSSEEADAMFKAIDINGNGQLSIDEFAQRVLGDLRISESAESRYVQVAPSQRRAAPAQTAPPPVDRKTVDFTTTRENKVDFRKVEQVKTQITLNQEESINVSQMLLDTMKKTIIDRGGADSIAAIGRLFRIMDDDRNRKIDVDELQTGLGDYGLRLSKGDIILLMDAINDRPGMGTVTYDNLLYSLRGELNKRRASMVMQAFAQFDKSGNGVVDWQDLKENFDAEFHPDVRSGKKTQRQAIMQWLAVFEGHVKDGKVTKEEFLDYYANVSASIDSDEYFELMIRNAWHISGGKGQSQNTTNMRVLVVFRDGTQDVVTLQNDLGVDPHDVRTITGLLRKQGYSNIAKVRTMQ